MSKVTREELAAAALGGNGFAMQEYIRAYGEAPLPTQLTVPDTRAYDAKVKAANLRKYDDTQPRDSDGRLGYPELGSIGGFAAGGNYPGDGSAVGSVQSNGS